MSSTRPKSGPCGGLWTWFRAHPQCCCSNDAGARERALRAPPRAQQVVHLLLLSHDDVLEAVLDGLGGRLAAGGLDRGLEGLERLRLALDQAVDRRVRVGHEPRRGDLGGRLAPSAVIFSTRRVASSSSESECSRIFSACAWYSSPITLPATSEYWSTERCWRRSASFRHSICFSTSIFSSAIRRFYPSEPPRVTSRRGICRASGTRRTQTAAA